MVSARLELFALGIVDVLSALRDHSAMEWSYILSTMQRILEPLPIRGKGRLSQAVFRFLQANEAQCHPLPNVTVHVRPEVWIERLMWAGAYERELVDLFKRVLGPGMVALDVGANIGYFSALAAGLVGPTGLVHSFEPAPTCFSQLKRNLAAFSWADASPFAVADESGIARFHLSEQPNQTGWGSLLADEKGVMQETGVQVVTLDQWVRQQGIRRIDFIKMDVEGAEYRALLGATELLQKCRPLIVAELNSACLARDGRTPEDILGLLRSTGYETFAFNDGVLAMPVEVCNHTSAIAHFTTTLPKMELQAPVSVES